MPKRQPVAPHLDEFLHHDGPETRQLKLKLMGTFLSETFNSQHSTLNVQATPESEHRWMFDVEC